MSIENIESMGIETPCLNPGMLARYEIAERRPGRINTVQFGMGEKLLGAVDRLLDGAGLGILCVEPEGDGLAPRLSAQGGLYTVILRGYERDEAVRRETVVQCVLDAAGPEGLDRLAQSPDIELMIVDDTSEAQAMAEGFARSRMKAGLPAPFALCLGAPVEGAVCALAMADALVFRAEADEAARECAAMNYRDELLHLGEPFARLSLWAPEAFRQRFALDALEGVRFLDEADFERERLLVNRVFGGGVFLMAAAGWLNGCDTLSDCMKHPRLRRFVGEAFTGELMPLLHDVPREALEARVIESFGRYENPLSRSRLLKAAAGLSGWLLRHGLPMMRAWAEENFEPPRGMAFALAATVMLYAGARLNPETGRYEVARGRQAEALRDDPDRLRVFASLAHDMPPESLAYAALADRELWNGLDLRQIDGLEARVALDIANIQREPGFLAYASSAGGSGI